MDARTAAVETPHLLVQGVNWNFVTQQSAMSMRCHRSDSSPSKVESLETDQLVGQWIGDRVAQKLHRYTIEALLGKQTGRRTYLATDSETEQQVVIKLVLFGPDFTWSDLRLFEREAETLRSLNHPAIPNYLNSFEVDTPMGKGFALVQTYIKARSLQQWVKAGRTFSETELITIATQVLTILSYLHQRHPPVIHRDIKPSNVLLVGYRDGRLGDLYLIDFGSVQTTPSSGTMTVVGTYGYMPIEQFGGRALPASDLYSLGATLLFLATGLHPADLTQSNFQIVFEQQVSFTPHFAQWMRQLTDADLSQRTASAAQALEDLATQAPAHLRLHPPHFREGDPAFELLEGSPTLLPAPVWSAPISSPIRETSHNLNDIEIDSTPEKVSIQLLQARLIEKKSARGILPFFAGVFAIIVLIYVSFAGELSVGLGVVFLLWFVLTAGQGLLRSQVKKEFTGTQKTTLTFWFSANGSAFLSFIPAALSSEKTTQNKLVKTVSDMSCFPRLVMTAEKAVRFPIRTIRIRAAGKQVHFMLGGDDYVSGKLCIRGSREEINFLWPYLSQYNSVSKLRRFAQIKRRLRR